MKALKQGLLAAAALLAMTGAAQAEITIGVATMVTGPVAAIGEQLRRGAELAVADLNAKGGVLGEQLRLVVGDDVCEEKQAIPVANQMVNEGAVFVVGHACSGTTIPASEVYEEEGIIMMTPSATSEVVTSRGLQNIFRIVGTNPQQGELAAQYLVENFRDKKIAIIHDKDAYGQGLADQVKKSLNAAGVQEALYDSINAGEKDYSALVSRLKQLGIEALYYGGYHPELGLIVRQLADQGAKLTIIGGDSLITDEYTGITGPAGDGTLFTYLPDFKESEEAKPVVEAFRAQGRDPEGYTLNSYAAVQVWAQAAEKAGTTDAEAVAKVLHDETFESVLGMIDFDEKGDLAVNAFVIWEYQNGKPVQKTGK